MQLLLFRSIARGDTNVGALGKMYVPGSGQNINDSSRAFIDQIFRPMGRELIRHLRRAGLSAEGEAKDAPASDRPCPSITTAQNTARCSQPGAAARYRQIDSI